jgi:hypothetical protein
LSLSLWAANRFSVRHIFLALVKNVAIRPTDDQTNRLIYSRFVILRAHLHAFQVSPTSSITSGVCGWKLLFLCSLFFQHVAASVFLHAGRGPLQWLRVFTCFSVTSCKEFAFLPSHERHVCVYSLLLMHVSQHFFLRNDVAKK